MDPDPVHFFGAGSNRHSGEIRAHAEWVEFWQDGKIVGQHDRACGRDTAITYDPPETWLKFNDGP